MRPEDRTDEEERKLADKEYLRQRVNEFYDRQRGQQIADNARGLPTSRAERSS
ncbi:hypothetical protein [Nonomuraea sp. NPDC049028]|uniref:hypothetical protein n=1 Tax=Nonomuraea sp. NPDC049028 TaxID=3364348 RepID=UPI00371D3F25